MDLVIFNIENHTISYQVNWFGIETIKIDGIQISKKLSLPKRKHKFKLHVFGKDEAFYIKSKQIFSLGYITVQLFHNDILIDEKILEFNFGFRKDEIKNAENSSFMTGMIFIVFSFIFGWSKFFLFIGLIYVFSSFFEKEANAISTKNRKDSDPNN